MRVFLRDARLAKGHSPVSVAYHIGLSERAIMQWERGERTPSRRHQLALAKFLDAPHLLELFDAELQQEGVA